MPTSPSLLGIPFEVRAMVIQRVILTPRSNPPSLDELVQQQRQPLDKFNHHRVSFLAGPATNPALALLLTNRQLYDETFDTLQRTFKATKSVSYTADIIYLNNGTLWPTWLFTPVRAPHADTVHVQFRVFPYPEELRPGGAPRHRLFNGRSVMWSFYYLLLNSLVSGSHGPCGQPISMNRLVLDFLPATETDNILPLGPSVSWEWVSNREELGERIFAKDIRENISEYFDLPASMEALCRDDVGMEAAARLMSYVSGSLEWLAKLDDIWVYDQGRKLHEHIGVIEVRLDGELHKTLDLGRYLADSPPGFGGDARSWRYWKWHNHFVGWRREVEVKRRELGMPVYE